MKLVAIKATTSIGGTKQLDPITQAPIKTTKPPVLVKAPAKVPIKTAPKAPVKSSPKKPVADAKEKKEEETVGQKVKENPITEVKSGFLNSGVAKVLLVIGALGIIGIIIKKIK